MTFVQLLERLRVECGVSGQPITDVTTVTGEHLRLKNWLQSAVLDIQRQSGGLWEFLRREGSHTIPVDGSLLSIAEWSAEAVAQWKIDEFRIAPFGTARGLSIPMVFVPYDQFRNGVGLLTTPAAKPIYFTVRRGDKAVLVAPQADAQYTLFFDYWSAPIAVEDDDDQPPFPLEFHMLAVYKAMQDYGLYEAAPEVVQRARDRYDEMIFTLRLQQLPPPTWGGPLA